MAFTTGIEGPDDAEPLLPVEHPATARVISAKVRNMRRIGWFRLSRLLLTTPQSV
jgi:hypothetical protein